MVGLSVYYTFLDPSFWKVTAAASVLLLFGFTYYSDSYLIFLDIYNLYHQITDYPDLVNSLNELYPSLTTFNKESANLLSVKSVHRLSQEQCELIVKFCIDSKISILQDVLLSIRPIVLTILMVSCFLKSQFNKISSSYFFCARQK